MHDAARCGADARGERRRRDASGGAARTFLRECGDRFLSERPRALIVAFDGVLADTLPLRVDAVVAAARAHEIIVSADAAYHVLPGRTIRECVEQLCAHEPITQRDPTLLELVIQSAEREMGRAVRSATFFPLAIAQIAGSAARGTRIVVRSDSCRNQVSALLEQHGIERIATLRCLDDPTAAPPVHVQIAPDYPALERLWHDIDRRLTNLAMPRESRAAQEAAPAPQAVADRYAGFVGSTTLTP